MTQANDSAQTAAGADFEQELRCEIAIIGAGLIGSAVAMSLAELGAHDVLLIDPDFEGIYSSSELNAGGVRATFAQPINIEFSKVSIDYFDQHRDQVGYRPVGYLWLRNAEQLTRSRASRGALERAGWPVEEWSVAELERRIPFLEGLDPERIAGAVFGPRDGLINPNLLKLHYRGEARARGVRFLDRASLVSARRTPALTVGAAQAWELGLTRHRRELSEEARLQILTPGVSDAGQAASAVHALERGQTVRAKRVVNCAGAWAGRIASLLGYERPVRAIRRQISIFDCREVDLSSVGMVIGPNSIYFHPEATHGLAGFANYQEPEGYRFDYDRGQFFEEIIWPGLFEISPRFERVKEVTGWAGLYEVSPDESAFIGVVPEFTDQSVFEAHAFSGHGTMHSYAAGRAVAEQMLLGRFETIDATPLSGTRLKTHAWVRETAVI